MLFHTDSGVRLRILFFFSFILYWCISLYFMMFPFYFLFYLFRVIVWFSMFWSSVLVPAILCFVICLFYDVMFLNGSVLVTFLPYLLFLFSVSFSQRSPAPTQVVRQGQVRTVGRLSPRHRSVWAGYLQNAWASSGGQAQELLELRCRWWVPDPRVSYWCDLRARYGRQFFAFGVLRQ